MSDNLVLTLDVQLSPKLRNLVKLLDQSDNADKVILNASDASITLEEQRQESYNAGVADGRAEAQQEHAMRKCARPLESLLPYDNVLLCLYGGMAPFLFEPICVTTFGKLSPGKQESLGPDLADLPKTTVGIYGFNKLTQKFAFYTDYDHFTLANPTSSS